MYSDLMWRIKKKENKIMKQPKKIKDKTPFESIYYWYHPNDSTDKMNNTKKDKIY